MPEIVKGMINKNLLSKEQREEFESFEKNRIIVRVWTSGFNVKNKGKGPGHVSIETPNHYMSLWPTDLAKDSEGSGFKQGISHEFVPTFAQDRLQEGKRDPEYTFIFYCLSTSEIEKFFSQTCQVEIKKWSVLGLGKDTESCASVAWNVLKAGGLNIYVNKIKRMLTAKKEKKAATVKFTPSLFNTSKYSKHDKEEGEGNLTYLLNKVLEGGPVYIAEMLVSGKIKSPDYLAAILLIAQQKEFEATPVLQKIYESQSSVATVSSTP